MPNRPQDVEASRRSMFSRLGNFVAQRWFLVILFWIILVVSVRISAPRWNDITHDGDFAYLPPDRPSVVGEKLLAQAFPHKRSKSQIVILVSRASEKLSNDDIYVANDLARRFRNLHGAVRFERGKTLAAEAEQMRQQGDAAAAQVLEQRSDEAILDSVSALEESVRLDSALADYRASRQASVPEKTSRLAAAHHNLALAYDYLLRSDEARQHRQLAVGFDPAMKTFGDQTAPKDAAAWPLLDVWTWHDDVVGEKLISKDKHARLIILQLSNEFMATDNIRVLDDVEAELDEVRRELPSHTKAGLTIGYSGSAAIGGDLLRAARDSIRHTEMFTIILVVLILGFVYRSPLLVAVPLVTIAASLFVSTGIVALLTQLNLVPGFQWWDFKVFTTTKIFIVVILFGSGTDFCLFLISRYKEELGRGLDHDAATAAALAGVGDALAASALTTILGLSMMFFAEFGKLRYNGPVIALCLAVTLVACVTLAPAMLRALGRSIFWPFNLSAPPVNPTEDSGAQLPDSGNGSTWSELVWQKLARPIVARPGLILAGSILVMLPLAGYGMASSNHVTYDLLSSLSPNRPSRRGAEILRRHFDVGESGPVTVLVQRDGGNFNTQSGRLEIAALTHQLYVPSDTELATFQENHPELAAEIQPLFESGDPSIRLPRLHLLASAYPQVKSLLGVAGVRSVSDPLADYPPGRRIGVLSRNSWRTRMMRPHKLVQHVFVAHTPEMMANVARFEVLLKHDPFSLAATEELRRIDRKLSEISRDPNSFWHGCTFAYTGTTAAMRDLRDVTQSDNRRIQILVVVAVSAVLMVILRHPLICAYMVASVLLSYFVTIGATQLFFGWAYGATYQGLDWKVPLFLFVILVAIGQDYNVYLATRVFEEQARYGPFMGLRRAVVRTGGIITSCGIIMAGTFITMTSGTWGYAVPDWIPYSQLIFSTSAGTLRSIVELGFALSLGVMLDTFIVRPVLLPAFLAILCRWQTSRNWSLLPLATQLPPVSSDSATTTQSGPAG